VKAALKLCRTLHDGQVHYANGERLVASFGMVLRISEDAGISWRSLATLPVPFPVKVACRFDLCRRLFREGIHGVIPAGDEGRLWLAIARRQVYRIDAAQGNVTHLWSIQRGRRPLPRGWAVVGEHLFVGDYFGNPDREAVRIYRIQIPTGRWNVFYEFPARAVRHVHVVQYDSRLHRLWVATGDEDAECSIGMLCPDTGKMTRVGGGSQDWRVVSLAMTDQAVYWGTDNHTGHNRIWKLPHGQEHPVALGNVIGPVYYHGWLNGRIVFATTVEKGEGQQDSYGRLYSVDANDRISLIGEYRKDLWSPKFFGYGVMEFAQGDVDGRQLWVTLKGYRGGLRSVQFSSPV
jgi:hypothetical protein